MESIIETCIMVDKGLTAYIVLVLTSIGAFGRCCAACSSLFTNFAASSCPAAGTMMLLIGGRAETMLWKPSDCQSCLYLGTDEERKESKVGVQQGRQAYTEQDSARIHVAWIHAA
jgi:hypothetical protein